MIDETQDCSQWDPHSARRFAIGLDIGFKVDHSCIVIAGEFPTPSGDVIALQKLTNFPLGTPYDDVIDTVAGDYRALVGHGRPCVIAVDSRNNLPFVTSLIRQGGIASLAVLGMNLSAAERNSTVPSRVALGGNTIIREFGLGRTPMFTQLASQVRQGHVRICEEDSDKLLGQLAGLQRETTRAGGVSISCPVGGHDDLAVAVGYACFVLGELSPRLTAPRNRVAVSTEQPMSSLGWT